MYLADFISFKFLEGPVIYPNDTLFPSLIIDQNIRVNYTSTVLVYAIDNKDVQKAVKCAVELKRDIVPRSGGHSYEKYGLGGRNNVIVLDLTFVNGITINSETETAKIGAGNRLGNVYNQLNQAGFLIPAGLCPSVGIGGHAFGGGFGYYSRKYGLACDNIISMEMVDAKGDILQVDSILNSNLYFALRGAGGGSYGIVTYFVFRIHRTPPQVTYMELAFNRANMTQVYQLFDAFNEVGPLLDDGIALKMRLNKGSLSITGLYLVVNPVHHPNFFKAKSFVVKGKGLTRQAIKVLVDFLNGAYCKILASFDLFEQNTKCTDEINAFGRNFQLNFTSDESYQDFIDRDLDDWQTRYYGDIFEKLANIKRKYDPNNLFNFLIVSLYRFRKF
ncbi:3319_t:CDS:2 [Gigaspora margarita]|uniref:3319_t:CDS:1 n=1 Tax=Gigaspora margarita TaxID=4874 RepID=A0ABN7V2H2_GIGMA|nr:3319_t:CDS:2 [Gigaspora margarita]